MADERPPPDAPAAPERSDAARMAEIVDVVVGIASHDFSRRAFVGDGTQLLDGLAAGVNMLAEEVALERAQQAVYQARLAQSERLLAVGKLAAGVAHEINNPAAFVLANLTALDDDLAQLEALCAGLPGAAGAEARALIGRTREATRENVTGVQKIVQIARELRTFSRVDPDRVESIALDTVVAEACVLVRAELGHRARLCVDEIALGAVRVRGERTKLAQVFTNLLINAAHAIAPGRVAENEVRVGARLQGERVVVSVRDTGTGISPEARARLFEPFFTTKARDIGTGLGLTLSADIVRHHGGELRLAETSARGTTFEVMLPLEGSLAGPIETPPPPAPRPGPAPARRPRLLLIDDEPMLLSAYARFLRADYELVTAEGGHAAIARLEADAAFDAILCDVMMPDLDGVAVHEWVTRHRPELAPRMLFCSGGAYTPRSVAFTQRLEQAIIEKPVRMPALREALARLVRG